MTDASERLTVLQGGGPQPKEAVRVRRTDDGVEGLTAVPDLGDVTFVARNVRHERSGLHAHVRIHVGSDSRAIGYSVINIERHEDRTRLANSAGHTVNPGKKALGAALKVRLDVFCDLVWPCWIGSFEPVDVSGEDATLPTWALEPYLLEGAGTILFGPPGAGKSWTAILWALAMRYGAGPWGVTKTSPTLFVDLERGNLGYRVAAAGKALGIDRAELLTLSARGKALADVEDSVIKAVKERGVGMVFVDSLSRAGMGDLNTNEAMNKAMDTLNGFGTGWCIIAHSPRADSTHTYGSVMADAGADLTVRLVSSTGTDPDTLGVQLEVMKANDVRKAAPAVWAYQMGDRGLVTVRRAEGGEFPDLTPASATSQEVVIAYLKRAGRASAGQIAEDTGLERGRVAAVMTSDRRIVKLGRDPDHTGRGRPPMLYGIRSQDESPPEW